MASIPLRRLAFGVALVVVLALMLVPVASTAGPDDKTSHFIVFTGLTVIGAWAFVPLVALTAGLIVFAALTEVAQSLTSYRFGDPRDFLADVIGIVIGIVVVLVLRRVLRASNARVRRRG